MGREEGSPGIFVVVVIVIVVVPWTAQASMSTVTGGMGSGSGAIVMASHVPLLSDGKLSYGSGDVFVIVAPSPQILPPGAGAIVESHLAAINGNQCCCSSATTTLTSTTTNATAVSSLSDALALLDSLEEATGDEDAAVVAVRSHAPPREVIDGSANSLSLIYQTFLN